MKNVFDTKHCFFGIKSINYDGMTQELQSITHGTILLLILVTMYIQISTYISVGVYFYDMIFVELKAFQLAFD